MSTPIAIPLWLAALVGVLAVWALIDRIIIPFVRWLMRRRFDRAIDELNTRLRLRIQPFKLAKRRALIDQIIFDPGVLREIDAYAAANNVSHKTAAARARRYAKEIVPSFSVFAYFGIGTKVARWLSTFLYRVRLGYMDEAALTKVDPDAAVVFVINHRSNMDYVLVTYMASTSSALSYAVGEWAQVWLLQSIVRSMGAYFVRRDSREPLYRKVLSRYVSMALAGGLAQAMFPEGGLTRDGLLRPPKFGLLNYMVSGFDPQGPRDAVFVPVGLNYDRILEDRMQVSATQEDKPRLRFSPWAFTAFLLSCLLLRLRGRLYRYGYACVSFGAPISLRDYLSERGFDFRTLDETRRFAEVERLGHFLMQRVGEVIPALPVSLVTTVLIGAEAPLSLLDLKVRVVELMERLSAKGVHVHIPRADQDYAVEVGLRMLRMRHLVIEEDGLLRAGSEELPLLRYYANSIAHLVAQPDEEPEAQPQAVAV